MTDQLDITVFGGPASGRSVKLRDNNIIAITATGGHYARVAGGRLNEWYWHDFNMPWGIIRHGKIVLVQTIDREDA